MGEVRLRDAGVVIPFPPARERRARAVEGQGRILLFTGVRYARLPDPEPEPTPAVDGRSVGRRRRRS